MLILNSGKKITRKSAVINPAKTFGGTQGLIIFLTLAVLADIADKMKKFSAALRGGIITVWTTKPYLLIPSVITLFYCNRFNLVSLYAVLFTVQFQEPRFLLKVTCAFNYRTLTYYRTHYSTKLYDLNC